MGQDSVQYNPKGTKDSMEHRQATQTQGKPSLTVLAVRPQSPAALQGVKPGDTVISMNGMTISNREEYDSTRQKAKGQPVTLILQRGNKQTSYELHPSHGDCRLACEQEMCLSKAESYNQLTDTHESFCFY